MKRYFLAIVDCFQDLGKEVLAFCVFFIGIILLTKNYINGEQFTDLVKTIGVAYIGGCAVGSTSDLLIKHLETKALEIKDQLINKGKT